MSSNWKVSPLNFRPWSLLAKHVELRPIPNMTIDLRNHKPGPQPWLATLLDQGGWRKR